MPEEKLNLPIYNPMPPEKLEMPPTREPKQEYGTSSLPDQTDSQADIGELLKNFRLG